jgi:hypothetical protein
MRPTWPPWKLVASLALLAMLGVALVLVGSVLGLWLAVACAGLLVLVLAWTRPAPWERGGRSVATPWGEVVQGRLSPLSQAITGVLVAAVLGLSALGGVNGADPLSWLPFLLTLGTLLLAWRLYRTSSGGIFPGWKESLLDSSLPPLDAGTPEEWVAGQGSLGGGGAASAMQAAAAYRAVWWEPEPHTAVVDLHWHVEPDPDEATLRAATKAGLRAARRGLPGRGAVRVVGQVRSQAGPDLVAIRLVVRAQGDAQEFARAAEQAFTAAFAARLQGHRLDRAPTGP